MSSYGGDGRCGGAHRSDQRPEQTSGPVSWPALQTSGGRGAPVYGGRGRGNAGRGSSSSRPPDVVSKEMGGKPLTVDVASSSATSVQVPESDSGSGLSQEKVQITPVTTLPPATWKAVTQPVRLSSSASSVQVPESDSGSGLSQELAEEVQITPVTTLLPTTSKAVTQPVRPGFRQSGKKIMIRANHFLVQVAERDIYHYDVAISPEVISMKVSRDVMKNLVRTYGESHLANKTLAYDGRKSLFTAGPLPFETIELVVDLKDKKVAGSSSSRKERQFKVALKLASRHDLFQLQQLLQRKTREAPYETFQVLDCFLRDLPSQEYVAIGRSLMDPTLGKSGELGDGIEYCSGYFQSLRLTRMGLSLNNDVSAGSFYEPILVTEFISKFMYLRDFNRPLKDSDRVKVKRVLRNLKIHLEQFNYERSANITGISSCPISQLSFTLDDNTQKTVIQYFAEKYNYRVKYPALPAIQTGSDSNPAYLPMELCRIAEGQRYTKRLNERQVTAMLEATCQRPPERESLIKGKMINGARVASWTCVSFSTRIDGDLHQEFCKQLIGICVSKGMEFNPKPAIPFISCQPQRIEEALAYIHQRAPGLQLLIVILPDVTGSYGKIKRVCETELGIVSQCCQPSSVRKLSKQYMENVALKINVKTGGRNTVLDDAIRRRTPLITDRPTIIMGADVTHPQPGEDSSPSIAAVVGPIDWPEIIKYRGLVSAQAHREEITPSSAGSIDSESLIGAAAKNQPAVMIDDAWIASVPRSAQNQPVGMPRNPKSQRRRRRQDERRRQQPSQSQLDDLEYSDDAQTHYELNNALQNPHLMVKPARSEVLAKVPDGLRKSLRVSKSVPITQKLAKIILGAERMDYLAEIDRAGGSLHLSDSSGHLFVYLPVKEPDGEHVGEEKARKVVEDSAGPVRDQDRHPLCWDFTLCDLMSSSAVMHGQMDDYRPLSHGWVCQNMDKKLYRSKLTAKSDLEDEKTHSCYEASLNEGLKFGKEKGIPLASKEENSKDWNCNYPRGVSRGEKIFKIKEVYRYFRLEDALIRLKTHAVGATLICFKGWEEKGLYVGPKEGASYEGSHEVIMLAYCEIDGKKAIRCKMSNGVHTANDGYIHVSPEVMVIDAGSARKKENDFTCWKKPTHLLYDFYSVEMENGDYGVKFQESEIRRERNQQFRVDFTPKGQRRGNHRGPRSGVPGDSSVKVSTQPPPVGVSLLIAGHDENGPSLYYTDPCGTSRQGNAKATGPGSEGADSSLQEQFNEPPPFGVSLLIAGQDENGPSLYYTDPCETSRQCNAKAIGPRSEGADSSLQEQFNEDLSLQEAETIDVPILKQLMEDKVSL